jgi:hypothetical protein
MTHRKSNHQMNLTTRIQRISKRLIERERPQAVMVYSSPLHFARVSLGFQPDEWQQKVLAWTGERLLLNCCRQSGKSTLSAIMALHRALYFPRSLILLVSPTLRQSQELFRKVVYFLSLLPLRPQLLEDNKLSLQLANGSRVVSLPAKESNVRGFSGPSLIIEDESARVMDDLYLALRPMLSVSNGSHILMSTPFGRRGHFFDVWEHGEGWEKVKITAAQCPRISREFLLEEQRTMPSNWFNAEYNCLFTETVDSVFAYADVMGAMDTTIKPLFERTV